MMILLSAASYRLLLGKTRAGTRAYAALQQADSLDKRSSILKDDFPIVCDRGTAEELLKTASVHCPEAVAIIAEAIEAESRFTRR
jgi:hypothetical protein